MAEIALSPPRQGQTCPLKSGAHRLRRSETAVVVDHQAVCGNTFVSDREAAFFQLRAFEPVGVLERRSRDRIAGPQGPGPSPKIRANVGPPSGLLAWVVLKEFEPPV